MSPANTPPALPTLILISAVSILTLNMFLPSLAHIAAEFETSYATISIAFAGYLAATAVLQLVIGPLSDRFGRRPVLLISVGIFVLASLGCALAPNALVFLIFRMFQGAMIAGSILSQAIIRDTTPKAQAAARIGTLAMVMALAPMLGPVIGGLLDQTFGWRASFWVYLILGIGVFSLAWLDLGETNSAKSASILAQFRSYPALLRDTAFWGYAMCLALSLGTFYGFLAGAPLVAAIGFDLGTAQLGLLMGSITGAYAFGNFLSSRFATRAGLYKMIRAGRSTVVCGLSLGLLGFFFGIGGLPLFVLSVLTIGLGNGLTLPSANVGAMSVNAKIAGSAAGLAGAFSVGSGALITLIVGAVLSRWPVIELHLAMLWLIAVTALATLLLIPKD